MVGAIISGATALTSSIFGMFAARKQRKISEQQFEDQTQAQLNMQNAALRQQEITSIFNAKQSLFDKTEMQRNSFIYIAIALVIFVIIALMYNDKN